MKKLLAILAAATALCATARVITCTPDNGEPIAVGGSGGKIVAVQAYSPTQSGGSVALSSVWSSEVWTNGSATVASTSYVYKVTYSNTVSAAVYTNSYTSLPAPAQIYSTILSVATNATVSTSTRTWSGYKETVATTNSIISGASATGKVYSGAPAETTYVGPYDWLIFTGTAASNGWLRIFLED